MMARRVHVGALAELTPRRGKRVEVEGRSLALFRLGDTVYAIGAVCPHRGGPLEEAELSGETVVCPWHAYDFDLRTGACGVAPGLRVPTVPVTVDGGEVYLELD
jgi:nitrite reductase/ring-hydroxylating ferredoxin subunit